MAVEDLAERIDALLGAMTRPPQHGGVAPEGRHFRSLTRSQPDQYSVGMSLYEDAGGFDVLLRLCRRWHELCLADPVAEHPFSMLLHPQHDERLAAYLAQALGGPELYTVGYGDETSMRRFHAGNGSSKELNDACLRLFDQALGEVGIEGVTRDRISTYFREAAESFDAYADSKDLVPGDVPFNYE